MNIPDPTAAKSDDANARAQLTALLAEAHRLFRAKNRRQSAHALSLAETTAKHHNLHREAAQYRQALTILAQGGTPKLLARPLPKSPLP